MYSGSRTIERVGRHSAEVIVSLKNISGIGKPKIDLIVVR